MRRIFTATLALTFVAFLSSCGGGRKVSSDSVVPFTRDMMQKMVRDNIDLKQIQFYIDRRLILSRNLGDQKVEVNSGVVRLENGRYINEVIVPAFTPGVCDGTDNDRLLISFEKGNNDLAFGPGSGYTFNQYVLYGSEWKGGQASVTYDNNKFRARCGDCPDVASVLLVVRKNEIDRVQRKTRVLKGRTID